MCRGESHWWRDKDVCWSEIVHLAWSLWCEVAWKGILLERPASHGNNHLEQSKKKTEKNQWYSLTHTNSYSLELARSIHVLYSLNPENNRYSIQFKNRINIKHNLLILHKFWYTYHDRVCHLDLELNSACGSVFIHKFNVNNSILNHFMVDSPF